MQEGFCNLMELKALLTIADFCSTALLFSVKNPKPTQNRRKQQLFSGKKKSQTSTYTLLHFCFECSVLERYSKEANDRSELIRPEVLKEKLSRTICYFTADSRTFSSCAYSTSPSAHCFSFSDSCAFPVQTSLIHSELSAGQRKTCTTFHQGIRSTTLSTINLYL